MTITFSGTRKLCGESAYVNGKWVQAHPTGEVFSVIKSWPMESAWPLCRTMVCGKTRRWQFELRRAAMGRNARYEQPRSVRGILGRWFESVMHHRKTWPRLMAPPNG